MNKYNDYDSDEAILAQLVERLKSCLVGVIPAGSSLIRVISTEPDGCLSPGTVCLLLDNITRKQHAQLVSEMNFWWSEDYLDCLDYTDERITYSEQQKNRLLNLLTPRN